MYHVRRIQERVTDPLASVELIETPEGGENNPELEQLLNETNPGGTPGGDGSANPLNFESGQLNEPGPIIGSGGEPLPVPLSGLEREYVWGPGDNGLDEILVQYDTERKAFWMIQDGGGDVVAMCDLAGSGGTARVVKSWQYDAYGQCLRATDVVAPTGNYSIPMNRIGHKGLFMDRLDVSAANPGTYADNPRLAPFSTVLYQNRNRTYSPQLGRFIQREPNESGQLLAMMQRYHSCKPSESGGSMSIETLFGSGGSVYSYLRSNSWLKLDHLGLSDYSLSGQAINTMASANIQAAQYSAMTGVATAPAWATAGSAAIQGSIMPGLVLGTLSTTKLGVWVGALIIGGSAVAVHEVARGYIASANEQPLPREKPTPINMSFDSRGAAFNQAKRDLDVPISQQPSRVVKPNTPEGREVALDSRNVVLYEFVNNQGARVWIREDLAFNYGSPGGAGNQGPHFNTGPAGSQSNLVNHYYFGPASPSQ